MLPLSLLSAAPMHWCVSAVNVTADDLLVGWHERRCSLSGRPQRLRLHLHGLLHGMPCIGKPLRLTYRVVYKLPRLPFHGFRLIFLAFANSLSVLYASPGRPADRQALLI